MDKNLYGRSAGYSIGVGCEKIPNVLSITNSSNEPKFNAISGHQVKENTAIGTTGLDRKENVCIGIAVHKFPNHVPSEDVFSRILKTIKKLNIF
jgi:hypothetical protein